MSTNQIYLPKAAILNDSVKKMLVVGLFAISLGSLNACGSSSTPTPKKLSEDVEQVSPTTVISVTSQNSYKVPEGAEIIEKDGTFKTIDNVYDDQGTRILIPQGAIIKGTYRNDGASCSVAWTAVYANEDEYEDNKGSFSLSKVTQPTNCDPQYGVKSGNRLIINFNKDSSNS